MAIFNLSIKGGEMKFLKENKNNTLKAKIIYINMYWTLISLLSLISTAFSNPIKV